MNLTEIRIIKRDGKQENFSAAKITNAIGKAFEATGIPQQREELDLITRQGGVTLLTANHRCGRNSGPRGKRINEGTAGSGQEIHHLPSVEKYGKRPKNAHQAYHGRHCGHRQK